MLLLSKNGGNAFVLMFLQLFFAALFFISRVSCDGGGNEVYYRVIDDPNQDWITIYYCKLTNVETNSHGCFDDQNAQFKILKKYEMAETNFDRKEARKIDFGVYNDEASKYSMIPFEKLGFPIFSRVETSHSGWTGMIIRMAYGIPEANNPELPMFSSVHVYDFSEQCKGVIPHFSLGKTTGDYIGVVVYVNQKYNEYGWLFIKHKEHVCMYYAKLENLNDGHWGDDDTIPVRKVTKRVEDSNGKLHFKMLENYPTQNYLMRFFAFDPLFGCFVSMYWDGDRNHDPEAHFFKFDESNPLATPELVYSYALPDFNKDLLQSVLEERFLDAVKHVFQSYGGQIFVFGRHPDTCNGFIGHYKDPYVYYTKDMPNLNERTFDDDNLCDINNRDITHLYEVPLMYVKEDWVTFTIPAYKMNGPIPLPTPPPSTSTTTSTTSTTTTTTTTTTTPEKPSSSSTEVPSSSSVPTSTSSPEPVSSTEVSSTSESVTQQPAPASSSSTQSPISNSTEEYLLSNASSTSLPSNSTNEKSLPYVAETTTGTSDGSKSLCSSYVDDCLWCLILLIIIDILLLVVFIILIIFERRGANQRKSETAQETEAATTAAGTEMSKHSNVKSQKKSKTKKSQSETVGTTTAAGDETTIKKIDTIDDGTKGTKFFTVNSDFEKPSKKKKKAASKK